MGEITQINIDTIYAVNQKGLVNRRGYRGGGGAGAPVTFQVLQIRCKRPPVKFANKVQLGVIFCQIG